MLNTTLPCLLLSAVNVPAKPKLRRHLTKIFLSFHAEQTAAYQKDHRFSYLSVDQEYLRLAHQASRSNAQALCDSLIHSQQAKLLNWTETLWS